MKCKHLCALIALSLGMVANATNAQDYDDRWYVAPYIGANLNDEDRLSDDGTLMLGMGIGRYINPNVAIDVFVDRTQRGANEEGRALLGSDDSMDGTMFGVAARFLFGDTDAWRPYILVGAGAINHRNAAEDGWAGGVLAGGGLQKSLNDNVAFRSELAYRYDFDDESIPTEDGFGDWQLNLGLTIALGDAGEAPPPAPRAVDEVSEPATQTDCSSLDDDRDGVNNCDDKCPDTASGTIVGPDGCAQEVVIDLRGVNFLFDRPSPGQENDIDNAGLLPGSIEILDQAVDVLNRYPNIKVEVAGHTDSTGSDEYNQSLSERRARTVYQYLTSHGVDASRLVGPNGYGEAQPIDTNDTKEGRQRNRRTELVVEK